MARRHPPPNDAAGLRASPWGAREEEGRRRGGHLSSRRFASTASSSASFSSASSSSFSRLWAGGELIASARISSSSWVPLACSSPESASACPGSVTPSLSLPSSSRSSCPPRRGWSSSADASSSSSSEKPSSSNLCCASAEYLNQFRRANFPFLGAARPRIA